MKIKIIFLIIIILLLLGGCSSPRAQPGHPVLEQSAKWVCNEYDIYFIVDLDDEDFKYYHNSYGEITIAGVTSRIEIGITGDYCNSGISFDRIKEIDEVSDGGGVLIISDGNGNTIITKYEFLFFGKCTLNENKDVLTVKIKWHFKNNIIDKSVKELKFTKHDIEN